MFPPTFPHFFSLQNRAQTTEFKDKVNEGEVDIQYCHMDNMWSDVLNKLKQGTSFNKDRSVFMNVPMGYDDQS